MGIAVEQFIQAKKLRITTSNYNGLECSYVHTHTQIHKLGYLTFLQITLSINIILARGITAQHDTPNKHDTCFHTTIQFEVLCNR